MRVSVRVLAGLTTASLLFTGCMYDPHAKSIMFSGGKPYRLPYGVKYSQPLKANDIALKIHNEAGIDCRPGDIRWTENSLHDKLGKILSDTKLTEKQKYANVVAALRQGHKELKAGCAHPLNSQEYNYYVNQQNQQAANARASDLSTAITAPKTYNVNYTGTVYHY